VRFWRHWRLANRQAGRRGLSISPEHVAPGYQVGWAESAEVPAPLDEEQPLLVCPVTVCRRLRCGRNIHLRPQHQSFTSSIARAESTIRVCCTPAEKNSGEAHTSPNFDNPAGRPFHWRYHAPDAQQFDPRRPVIVRPQTCGTQATTACRDAKEQTAWSRKLVQLPKANR